MENRDETTVLGKEVSVSLALGEGEATASVWGWVSHFDILRGLLADLGWEIIYLVG